MKTTIRTRLAAGVIPLIVFSLLFLGGAKAHAGFFDDFVDFVNPVNQVNNVLDGHPEDNLPPVIPDGIGTPTIPNPLDILSGPPLDPIVETKGTSDVTSTSAHVKGYANPNGAPDTTAWIEWGAGSDLSHKTDVKAIPLPSELNEVISGLAPNTTYSYRVVAKNALFTEEGDTKSFRTPNENGVVCSRSCAPNFTATCSGTPSSKLGDPSTYDVAVTGGSGPFTYAWKDADGTALGTSKSVTKTYTTLGDKSVLLTVASADNQKLFLSCSTIIVPVTTPSAPCPVAHTMTLDEVKAAITLGGSGHGVILREIDAHTGNGVVVNDTDCPFPVSIASYTLDNPSDQGYVEQTFFAASPAGTISQPHSTMTLHTALPSCNFQADYFYGDNYPRPHGSRDHQSPYFLDSGYIVNRVSAGGFACTVQPPVLVPVCVANPTSSVAIGQPVSYTVTATGGTGSYTYSWSGTENLSGTTATVSKIYSTAGDKAATASVTSQDGQTKTVTCNTTVTTPPVNPAVLDVSCPAISSPVNINQSVTRTVAISGGVAPYQISWTGSDSLSGTDASITKTYTTTGEKTASVTVVDAKNQLKTATCNTLIVQTTVVVTDFSVTCPDIGSPVNVREDVTRQVNISGGVAPYQISWTGSDDLSGNSTSITKSYSSAGTKDASVTVTDSAGRVITRTCNTLVVDSISGGGHHSSSSSPKKKPIVSLLQTVQPAPLANATVYLSQAPYTGVDSYPKLALFILGLIFWSVVIALGIKIRNVRRNQKMTILQSAVETGKSQSVQASAASFAASTFSREEEERISARIESEARREHALISEDAVKAIVLSLSGKAENASPLLASIIRSARAEAEKSEEWITLSGEKVRKILFASFIALIPNFVEYLKDGNAEKALSFFEMVKTSGHSVTEFIQNVVLELRIVLSNRARGEYAESAIEKAVSAWDNAALERAILALEAKEEGHRSAFIGAKLSLLKVLSLGK